MEKIKSCDICQALLTDSEGETVKSNLHLKKYVPHKYVYRNICIECVEQKKHLEFKEQGFEENGYSMQSTYELSGMDYSEPNLIPCHHCNVPMENHGTCCGWENASVKVTLDLTIIDGNHPGFGRNLNEWKRDYFVNKAAKK